MTGIRHDYHGTQHSSITIETTSAARFCPAYWFCAIDVAHTIQRSSWQLCFVMRSQCTTCRLAHIGFCGFDGISKCASAGHANEDEKPILPCRLGLLGVASQPTTICCCCDVVKLLKLVGDVVFQWFQYDEIVTVGTKLFCRLWHDWKFAILRITCWLGVRDEMPLKVLTVAIHRVRA